jgi:hypothetical protein
VRLRAICENLERALRIFIWAETWPGVTRHVCELERRRCIPHDKARVSCS